MNTGTHTGVCFFVLNAFKAEAKRDKAEARGVTETALHLLLLLLLQAAKKYCPEDSQEVPARPSGKGRLEPSQRVVKWAIWSFFCIEYSSISERTLHVGRFPGFW
jgi:hypothetical protein